MSKLRKPSDSGVVCQGGGARDAKRRKLDVLRTDGKTLKTLFVNTHRSNLQHTYIYKHSDQDPSDEDNNAASQATKEGMIGKDKKVKATQKS